MTLLQTVTKLNFTILTAATTYIVIVVAVEIFKKWLKIHPAIVFLRVSSFLSTYSLYCNKNVTYYYRIIKNKSLHHVTPNVTATTLNGELLHHCNSP